MNSRHPDPRRVLGRCRAAVRGQDPDDPLDPDDPGMKSLFRVLAIKSNEHENPISKLSILQCFCWFVRSIFHFTVFYNDLGCIFAQKLLKSCSGGPRRLWRSGSAHGVVMGLSWGFMGLSWGCHGVAMGLPWGCHGDRKSTRLNSSHT